MPLSQTGSELLFDVFSRRYENGATIVTSNKSSSKNSKFWFLMISRYHLSNTADEMTVRGEFTVRKECFETVDDGVEIGEMYDVPSW